MILTQVPFGDPDYVSKNMDLINVVNGGTYDERNILGRCKLCILKCAGFIFYFLILCAMKYTAKANSLKNAI